MTLSTQRACFLCSQRCDKGINSDDNHCTISEGSTKDDAGKLTHFCFLCQKIFRALGIKRDGKLLSEVISGKSESILAHCRLAGDCELP